MNTDDLKKLILIVEDEVVIATDLKYLIEGLGHRVGALATSAEEAIEIIQKEAIDLILMDIVLDGDMDGIDASEIIRDQWGVPVVFLTAYADNERLERAKLVYPFGYILKPFQERDIKITIEMALFASAQERKRKEMDEALREKEKLYRIMIETSPDPIIMTNMNSELIIANSKALEVYGYESVEDARRRRPQTLSGLTPEDRDRYVLDIFAAFEEGRAVTGEYTALKADGAPFPAEISTSVYRDGQGIAQNVISIIRDVTERKAHEAAIRLSEKKYKVLFNSINDYLYSHDYQGRIIMVNQALCESLGYRPEEIIGRPVTDFMISQYRDIFTSQYMKNIKDHGRDQGVFQVLGKDSRRHYLEYRNAVISLEGEEPYVTGLARDITDRVMADRELRQMEEQIFQLQKMEAVGTLAGGIAHDFNNLLQTLNIYTQIMVMEKKESDPDLPNLLAIRDAGQKAAELVKQLLLFSRKTKADHRPLDLNRLVDSVRRLLEQSLPDEIDIHFQPGRGLWTVKADHTQIKQVLMNLGNNAADAMPSGGRLTVFTENVSLDREATKNNFKTIPGNYVMITVSDTGCGMDKNTREHLFEPFFTTKEVGQGTGLGLASAYGIVKSHGGHITCTSQTGQGAVFNIFLPAFKMNNIPE